MGLWLGIIPSQSPFLVGMARSRSGRAALNDGLAPGNGDRPDAADATARVRSHATVARHRDGGRRAVSYTHLTLPTNRGG